MKTVQFVLLFSALSLVTMILIDYVIGAKAEFLNAFSVVQRIIGQEPTFGESLIAKQFGAIGEFIVVVLVNLTIGGLITSIILLLKRG